jgi:hypothetical protein
VLVEGAPFKGWRLRVDVPGLRADSEPVDDASTMPA